MGEFYSPLIYWMCPRTRFYVGDAVLSAPQNPHHAIVGGSQGTATPTVDGQVYYIIYVSGNVKIVCVGADSISARESEFTLGSVFTGRPGVRPLRKKSISVQYSRATEGGRPYNTIEILNKFIKI